MTARAIFTSKVNSHPFDDRVLLLDVPAKVGRAHKDDQVSFFTIWFWNLCPIHLLTQKHFEYIFNLLEYYYLCRVLRSFFWACTSQCWTCSQSKFYVYFLIRKLCPIHLLAQTYYEHQYYINVLLLSMLMFLACLKSFEQAHGQGNRLPRPRSKYKYFGMYQPKGPSMSFYPDFILILSWFYPNFIQIKSR